MSTYTHTQTHTLAYMQIYKYTPVTGTAATRRRGGILCWQPGGMHRTTHPIPERVGKASAHSGRGKTKDGFYVQFLKNNRQQVTDSRQLTKQELFTVSLFTQKVTTCPVLGERGLQTHGLVPSELQESIIAIKKKKKENKTTVLLKL